MAHLTKNISKKLLGLTAGAMTLLPGSGQAGDNPKAKKGKDKDLPNIIYVLADDLGIGDVSCFYDKGKIKTPHLDRMAAEGMRFTDAHTSSSVCTPTRYGILTGRYNWRSTLKKSVLGGYSPALIPEDRSTVASMLSDAGYNTSYIGKWHLGWGWQKGADGKVDFSKPITDSPNERGFDYAYGHCGSLDMAPYVYVENGKSTMVPTKTTVNKGGSAWWRKGLTADDFVHEQVTPNFFARAINKVKEQANGDKPFFIYLPLPSPHTPVLPIKEFQGKSGLNPYADFVMQVDDHMGKLLQTLKDVGIEDNTLIIFTSDNGCSPAAKMNELQDKGHYPSAQFRGHKADIFEGGHRVPFIVKWPARIKGGQVSDKTICTTDFMATCADIVGHKLKDNEGEDSYSMIPLLKRPNSKKFKRDYTIHHSIAGRFAIRQGDWKLAMCKGSGGWSAPRPPRKGKPAPEGWDEMPDFQLYNLKDDPGEKNNLFEKEPEKARELKALLMKCIDDGRSTPGAKQSNDVSPKGWPQLDDLRTAM
ncbi:arylsulfatase (plasmid) [Fulvitalea axinellae]|uniref:Arylsulfatase n=1 Tax=Fulvitalea axinellae TaxID=1182444 RepID=A0AAU9D035_9BACT|nr:arylsulfatase [Fulvitalea axinellae]